jgi:hypothetical protein
MEVTELVACLAAEWDLPVLSQAEMDEILAFAGEIAHMSERRAAPLACWLVGRSGRPLSDALAFVRSIAPTTSSE